MQDDADKAVTLVPEMPTAQALVRLRFLMEGAERLAGDASPAGQHQALIALDGVCEFALWLALNERGVVHSERDGLPELHSKFLKATGVKLPGWTTVNQMHRARNAAQHAGVAFSAENLPAWQDSGKAFVNALCVDVFGTELGDILLADAVRDAGIRRSLQLAEGQLQQDPSESLRLTREVFDTARSLWRAQLHARVLPLYQQPIEWNSQLAVHEPIDEFQELQPFASDIGEYVWFWRAGQELDLAGWEPDTEDARRALVFVTSWIVRWEIFALGYPDMEWAAHRESIEPPSTGEGDLARIIGVDMDILPGVPGRPLRHVIYCQVANVPGRGREPWPAILRETLIERGREATAAPFQAMAWSVGGILTVHAGLDADPSQTLEVIETAIHMSEERYAAATASSEQRERERKELEDALKAIVEEVADKHVALFSNVRVVPDEWLGTTEWIALFDIQTTGSDLMELTAAHNCFSNQRGIFPNLHERIRAVAFTIDELTSEIRAGIEAAIKEADVYVLRVREFYSKQVETIQQFQADIRSRYRQIGEQ